MQPVSNAVLVPVNQGNSIVSDENTLSTAQNDNTLDSAPDLACFNKILSHGKTAAASSKKKTVETEDEDTSEVNADTDLMLLLNSVIAQSIPIIPEVQEGTATTAGQEGTLITAVQEENIVTGVSGDTLGTVSAAGEQTQRTAADFPTADVTKTETEMLSGLQEAVETMIMPQMPVAASAEVSSQPPLQENQPLEGEKSEQHPQTQENAKISTALFQTNLTEKLKEAFASASGGGLSDDSQGKFVSKGNNADDADTVNIGQNDSAASNITFQELVSASDTAAAVPIDEKTTAVEKAIDKMIDDFSSVNAGQSEIRIVLEPKELGTMAITVLRTGNGISAKIESNDKDICSLVTDHIQRLVESIKNNGINLENVDVVFSPPEQEMSFSQNRSKDNRQEKSTIYLAAAGKKSESADLFGLLDILQGDLNTNNTTNGTVEYRV